MGSVLLDISISLDGIMATKDNYRLHQWYFKESDNVASSIVNELIETTGAIIMGRNTFELGHKFDGFVNNPYQVPHIVLMNSIPQFTPKGDTEFIYVTDGIESALTHAKKAAGQKDIVVTGGVDTARQFLHGHYLDEIQLHLVPTMIGHGTRLFEQNDQDLQGEWQCVSVKQSFDAVHLRYRSKRKREEE